MVQCLPSMKAIICISNLKTTDIVLIKRVSIAKFTFIEVSIVWKTFTYLHIHNRNATEGKCVVYIWSQIRNIDLELNIIDLNRAFLSGGRHTSFAITRCSAHYYIHCILRNIIDRFGLMLIFIYGLLRISSKIIINSLFVIFGNPPTNTLTFWNTERTDSIKIFAEARTYQTCSVYNLYSTLQTTH